MLVRCLANTNADIPAEFLDPAGGLARDAKYDLTIGQEYVVYALAVRRGQCWYYFGGDDHPYYPVSYPAPLFSVSDARLSSRWRYAYTPAHRDHQLLMTFAEWANDPLFYDRLTDMEPAEMQMYQQEKAHMDGEHAP